MRRSHRTTVLVLISVAALLCASMLAPAFGAPQATSAASLAKKLASTLKIAKRADRNAKRAIRGLQVEGKQGAAGPPGATGPAGAAGGAGAKGDKGDPATRLWAVINVSGTTARGSGVTGSAKLPITGQYEVVFNRDVTACSFQATLSTDHGEVYAQPRSNVPNGVFVATFTSAGSPADRAFHLAVFC
jgi:hypothetical protein